MLRDRLPVVKGEATIEWMRALHAAPDPNEMRNPGKEL
jgi:hypothetical protein